MATFTHRVTTPDAGNLPNSSGATTPAVGDLVVVFATVEANTADKTITGTGGYNLTYTQIRKQVYRTSADQLTCWVSTTKVTSATSGAITLPSGGSGSNISVFTVTGLHASALGAAAVRQSGGESDQASGEVPSVNFDTGVALSDSGIIGAIGVNDGTPALTEPASFTEGSDTGYTTGQAEGIETVYRNSGHTSQTVAWQTATTGGVYASLILELKGSVSNTDRRLGQIDITGAIRETYSVAVTYTDRRSGQIDVLGTRRESLSHTSRPTAGLIVVSGTVSESWSRQNIDRRSGQIDVTGTRREENSRTAKTTGLIVVSGTLGESFTPGGITNTDKVSGTITVTGTVSESWSLTFTDRRSGQIDISGTRREQYLSATYDRRSGTVTVSGTRREESSQTARSSGTVLLSGTLGEQYIGPTVDSVTGTITLSGTRRESQSRTVERSGTIDITGALREQYAGSTTDRRSGTITVTGTVSESYTTPTVYTDTPTGTINVSGSVSEQYIGATVDRRSGIIEITGTRSESWYWTATDKRTGTITVSGQITEIYQPSGVTTDKTTGTITVSGSVLDIHSRWDNLGGERWPHDTDSRWSEDAVSDRWEVDPVA